MQMTNVRGRVVLSGASGSLGGALRRVLAVRGVPELQLVRGAVTRPDQAAWNPGAIPTMVDTAPLEDAWAAIHLSGANVAAHRWTAAYRREMALSRVGTTRALATLLAGLHRPPQVLLAASAIGFYGNRGNEILDESSPVGSGFLAELCQQWEAAAQPAIQAGMRVVHLRLGVVLGPGSGALAKMLPAFRWGIGGRLGSGQQWMSWIGLEDVVRAALFALETPSLAGPVNLTAPIPVTNAEFTRVLARQLRRPAVLPAPAFALRLALGQMADEALLASARALPRKLTDAGFRFSYPAVNEALAAAIA